ncbi:hypothetical protein OIU78_003067 [Salix suchowensis]|nr:hypothetical protein OIU78_003067 [Salix suchowensis]
MENKEKVLMQKHEIGRLLARSNLKTGMIVKIKVIDREGTRGWNNGPGQVGLFFFFTRLIRHRNVVMATKTRIYFGREYVQGGELFKAAKGKLKEDAARKYFQQLISAVASATLANEALLNRFGPFHGFPSQHSGEMQGDRGSMTFFKGEVGIGGESPRYLEK